MTIISDRNEIPEAVIRQAKIDDLPQIFHLGEKVFTAQDFSNLYRTWDEFEVTYFYNANPEFMLVATINDRVVGFAMGSIIEKTGTPWNYGHLIWLGVEPEFSRQGIASKLFDRFKELTKQTGVRILMVDTQADNKKAINFFRKKGFMNPVDHVYMTLNLESED